MIDTTYVWPMPPTPVKIDIKRAVSENRVAYYTHYHDGALWYKTAFDEAFPVPVSDIGNATFNTQEKAILLMRYMRKWNETIKAKMEG